MPTPSQTARPTLPTGSRASRRVVQQLADLSRSVPQVVAHRTARMALAQPVMSERDRREFTGMVLEKQVAAWQSWQGMWWAGVQATQRMVMGAWAGAWQGQAPHGPSTRQLQQAGTQVLAAGLQPYQKKAAQNAKRLAKTRLR